MKTQTDTFNKSTTRFKRTISMPLNNILFNNTLFEVKEENLELILNNEKNKSNANFNIYSDFIGDNIEKNEVANLLLNFSLIDMVDAVETVNSADAKNKEDINNFEDNKLYTCKDKYFCNNRNICSNKNKLNNNYTHTNSNSYNSHSTDEESRSEIFSIISRNKKSIYSPKIIPIRGNENIITPKIQKFLKSKSSSLINIPSNRKNMNDRPERISKPVCEFYKDMDFNFNSNSKHKQSYFQ